MVFFLFVISRMVKMGILNDSSIFECQIKSYKHDTEFVNLCFVNKVQVVVSVTYVLNLIVSVKLRYFVDNVIYE